MYRHLTLLVLVTFFAAACGGAGVAPPVPTPTPTSTPPGGVGQVSGTITVSVTAPAAQPPPANVPGLRTVWRAPSGAPRFVPDELLVKFQRGVPPAQAAALHAQLGTREIQRLERIGVSVLKIESGEPVLSVIGKYRSQASVQYAEPNFYRYLAATPNDPLYPSQWHYVNIGLPAAWNVVTGSSLVVVAVIDTGILFSHPDLSGVTVAGWDFYGNDSNPTDQGCPTSSDLSHGSHVAGTIAARTNNSTGVAGVNWGGSGKTKIMPLRIFGNYGGQCTATSSDIISAIAWAMSHSARVINMSFGGPDFSQSEQDAVTDAYNTGVILFAAAGNGDIFGNPIDCRAAPDPLAFYPAAYANVVGVAATNRSNGQAWYSNFGDCVDLAAPGGDTRTVLANGVLSTTGTVSSPNQYLFFQGTSMATPHAVGLAALLISKGVTGPANIQNVMQSTATDLGAPGRDPIFGWGLIDAADAVGVAGTNQMRAFTGDLSGSTITVLSDMVIVATNGTYLVTNAQAGTHSAFAWQDTNGNSVIDAGDLYGSRSGVVIVAGQTTPGINFSVSEVPLGSSPITPMRR